MNSFFYHLDCFKTPLTLRIYGKRSFSTKFGCLMSFPLLIFLLSVFALSDLVLKQYPAITIQSNIEDTSPYIGFGKSNMTLAFKVITENNFSSDIDPTYFSLFISNVVVNNTSHEVIATENKETKVCDENDFIDEGYYWKYGMANATCFGDNSSFEIGGYWTDPFISYVRVIMKLCSNDSSNGMICKSSDEIKNYFKNKLFTIYYNDRKYDLNDYQNPIETFYTTQYQMIDTSFRKQMKLFFKKVQVINDEGLILEDNKVTDSFTFDRIETDFTSDLSDSIFEVLIYSSRETQISLRRYEKFIKVLANLGGISYFMVFLEFALVMGIREYKLMKHLVNYLYSFPMKGRGITSGSKPTNDFELKITRIPPDPENLENIQTTQRNNLQNFPVEIVGFSTRDSFFIPQKHIVDETPDLNSVEKEFTKNNTTLHKAIELQNPFQKKGITIILDPPAEKTKINRLTNLFGRKKKELDKFENFAQFQQEENKKRKLDIGFWEYMKLKIKPWFKCIKINSTQKLFLQAQKRALGEIDFFMMLRKLQEIDKIKLILFSPEQIKLFNLLSKPMIFDEEEISEEIRRDDGFKISMNLNNSKMLSDRSVMREVLEYYKNIKEKKGNKIDEKLLSLIEQSLEQFNKYYKSTENIE